MVIRRTLFTLCRLDSEQRDYALRDVFNALRWWILPYRFVLERGRAAMRTRGCKAVPTAAGPVSDAAPARLRVAMPFRDNTSGTQMPTVCLVLTALSPEVDADTGLPMAASHRLGATTAWFRSPFTASGSLARCLLHWATCSGLNL